jgi:hypothetical protein
MALFSFLPFAAAILSLLLAVASVLRKKPSPLQSKGQVAAQCVWTEGCEIVRWWEWATAGFMATLTL